MAAKKPRAGTRAQLPLAFWDTSAIIPLCCHQAKSTAARQCVRRQSAQIVWWSASVEAFSAICRLEREGGFTSKGRQTAVKALEALRRKWHEISPSDEVRQTAERLLLTHPLRAADALQLAAAMVWCGNNPRARAFVSADIRLSEAAGKEGFNVIRL